MASGSHDFRQQMEHKDTRKNWSDPPTQIQIPSRQPAPRNLMRGEGHRTGHFNKLDPFSHTVAPMHKRPRASYDGQVGRVGENDFVSEKFRSDHKIASYKHHQAMDDNTLWDSRPVTSFSEMPNSSLEERITGQIRPRPRSTDSLDLGQIGPSVQDLRNEPGSFETRKRDRSPNYSSSFRLSPFPDHITLEPYVPHLDMQEVRKKKRITQMKDKDGKIRESFMTYSKPAAPGLNETWTSRVSQDPLVASLIRSTPKKSRVLSRFELDNSPIRVEVLMAHIGRNQLMPEELASLTFKDEFMDEGPSISLNFEDENLSIMERDIEWITTSPDTSLLLICLSRDGQLYRKFVHQRRINQRTLEPSNSPDRVLSFKVKGLRLGSEEVMSILKSLKGNKQAPKQFSQPSQFWNALIKSHQSTGIRRANSPIMHQTRDKSDSSVTSPEPEPDEVDSRPDMDAIPRSHTTEAVLTRRTRSTRAKDINAADNDEIILVYPFAGAGGIQITRGEHHRLEPGGYLNDTLIEFGLRLWIESVRQNNPELADQIHIFSPFFYKKLKNRNFEEGYNAVRKWTSKVDIFTKRYLVVPINDSERVHWYLAIILYPQNVLRMGTSEQVQVQTSSQVDEDVEMTDPINNEDLYVQEAQNDTPTPPAPIPSRASSPLGNLQPLDTTMEQREAGEVEEELKEIRTPESGLSPRELLDFTADELDDGEVDESWKLLQDCTYLLIFDSLGGRHPATFKNLKQYLAYEARHKRGIEIEDIDQMQHKQVKSPVQPNYCDCGVYVIQTAQTFLENADSFFQRLMDKKDPLTDHHSLWHQDKFGTKRQELFDSISTLSEEWKQYKKQLNPTLETQSSDVILEINDADKIAPKPPAEDDDDSEIEIVGEVTAPKGKVRSPQKRRRGL